MKLYYLVLNSNTSHYVSFELFANKFILFAPIVRPAAVST